MRYLVKNTKIVSTFGPSVTLSFVNSSDLANPQNQELIEKARGIIKDLIFSGINFVRFNFSHGSIDERLVRRSLINQVQKQLIEQQENNGFQYKFLRPIAFMADTKGPEIRVFDMPSTGVTYNIGQEVTVHCKDRVVGSSEGFSVLDSTGTYNMANDCTVGNIILLDDGKLSLEILSVDKEGGLVKAVAKNTHTLKTNKRINLPGADYSMAFLSEKDSEDVKFSLDYGYEYIALSFVNSKENIQSVRDLIDEYCREKKIENNLKIISKIETLKSCKNIDEIIDNSEGIMIARGDLGLEIPYYEVPFWTKEIIKKCRFKNKPVIVATQMLDSLEKNILPTRAEVSDVYRAAEMGADSTMLSGETAQGAFPVISVQTMCNIVFESEKHFNNEKFLCKFNENNISGFTEITQKICRGLAQVLDREKEVDAIVTLSSNISEEALIAISSMRLKQPLYNFIPVSCLCLYCEEPLLYSPEYKKIKQNLSTALYRSINPVLVTGLSDEEISALPAVFKDFNRVFSKNTPNPISFRKIVYLENETWKVTNA